MTPHRGDRARGDEEVGPGRRRVLFVSKWLDIGGAERFTSTALMRLDPNRFDLHLAIFRDVIGYPLPDHVPVSVLVSTRRHKSADVLRIVWRLARLVRQVRPDIIVSSYAYPSFVVGMALRLTRQRPKWLARVGTNPSRYEAGLRRPLMWLANRRADFFVANSNGLASAYARAYPFASGRVGHLPNAVDLDWLDRVEGTIEVRAKARRFRMVAVGRLVKDKRVDLLIDVLAAIAPTVDAELVVCGEGPEREALQAQAHARGVADRVNLLGFVDPLPWLAGSDLFVHASEHEGSPNALIEAHALGLPAVVTACDFGPAEIVRDGGSGWLVPVGDVDAFTAAVKDALSDIDRLRVMSARARDETRQQHASSRVIDELSSLLEELAAAPPGGTPNERAGSLLQIPRKEFDSL